MTALLLQGSAVLLGVIALTSVILSTDLMTRKSTGTSTIFQAHKSVFLFPDKTQVSIQTQDMHFGQERCVFRHKSGYFSATKVYFQTVWL